jgi:hypothetical protein
MISGSGLPPGQLPINYFPVQFTRRLSMAISERRREMKRRRQRREKRLKSRLKLAKATGNPRAAEVVHEKGRGEKKAGK